MEVSEKCCTKQELQVLERYIKFMTLKCVQIIVKTRLGQRICAKSDASDIGTNWFTLPIEDDRVLLGESKSVLQNNIPRLSSNLNIEISLTTSDNETMVLEIWTIGVTEPCRQKSLNYIYLRMGLIIKSIMSITRTNPSFRLASNQGSHTYSINYRIFMGNPVYETLGENYEEFKAGHVNTPLGVIHVTLNFRTKLIFEPKPVEPLEVANNYFTAAECNKINGHNTTSLNEGTEKGNISSISSAADASQCDIDYEAMEIWEKKNHGLFVPSIPEPIDERMIPESMFQHLLPKSASSSFDISLDQNNNSGLLEAEPEVFNDKEKEKSLNDSDSDASGIDDFVLVEMKAPFVDTSSNTLGTFFTDLPSLQSFHDLTLQDQVSEFNSQLVKMENEQPELDKFVDSICHIENYE